MTAKEALELAFDDAIVMDAAPISNAGSPGKMGNAGAMPGAHSSMGGGMGKDQSIAEHMAQYHKEGFNPAAGDKCYLYDNMVQSLQQQGMDIEEAKRRALQMHNGGAMASAMGQQGQQGQQMQPPDAAMQQEAAIQQMVQNPQAIENAPSQPLEQPEIIQTSEGDIPVQTTVQKAIVESLDTKAASGDPAASAALEELKDDVQEGTITPVGQSSEGNEVPQQPKMEFVSADGSFSVTPSAESVEIMQQDPSKKELYQTRVDLEAELQNAKSEAERKDLQESIDIVNRLFYGKEEEADKEVIAKEGEAKGNEPQTASVAPLPIDKTQRTPPSRPKREAPSKPEAPSDEEFMTEEGKYKIGDVTYTDVSKMGTFRGALAAFAAGLRGEQIITGWDRLTGTWDAMKRSAKGEAVRDGITSALLKTTIDSYGNKKGLSEDAKMELSIIKDMMDQAETPSEQMKAVKEFQKWKESYGKEMNQEVQAGGSGNFAGIANKSPEWKAPPTNIFPPLSPDERDTSFMDEKRTQIQDGLEQAGVGVDILDSINGSSVVQFKVQRHLNGTDKALQEALKKLEADLGITISYAPDKTSGSLRTGTITINNPKVKDASLRRLLEDQKGLEAAKKMDAPLLVGETADGKAVWCDAGEHGFLGGDSGGGKSERIIGMVSGAYSVKPPSELQVLFNAHANAADYEDFEDDPHTAGIGRNLDEVANNLTRANEEWKRRQKMFSKMGVRNLKEYNKKMDESGMSDRKLPQLLVITDEVTNLLAERPELADMIRGIVTNGRKFGVAHLGATQDMKATNMPTDIKGSLRMGVKATKKEAPRAIFDVHTDELGKLTPKGDIMYRDENGNLVRLRGTYADKKSRAKLRDYNTGKITAPAEEPPTEPKKPEVKETKEEKPKATEVPDLDISSLENGLTSRKERWKAAKAKADEEFIKTKDRKKYMQALEAAQKVVDEDDKILKLAFPSELGFQEIADGDAIEAETETEKENASEEETAEEENDDELMLFPSGKQVLAEAEESLKKQVQEWRKAIKSNAMTSDEAEKLNDAALQKIKEARKAVKEGKTGKEIHDMLYPGGLKPTDGKPQKGEPLIGETEEEKKAKEQTEKDKQLKSTVPTPKFYTGSSATHSDKAVKMLTPKEQKSLKETLVPPGWDFVTDNTFKAPAKTEHGKIFVQHPTNGSWGFIYQDSKTNSPKLFIDTDTSHPQYKGMVKNNQGEWEEAPEVKRARSEWKHEAKYGDPKKAKALKHKYYHLKNGRDANVLDEALDNRSIVANAVAEALEIMG